MATIFPNNPQINDQFQGYFWNGNAWKKITPAQSSSQSVSNSLKVGGKRVFVQEATPTAESTGDIWFKVIGL